MKDVSLTAAERHKLLAVLREMDGNSPSENRAEPRRKVLTELWIRTINNRKCTREKAVLINIAARGVGLLASRPIAVGSRFIVPLRFQDGGGWLVLCEVRNSTRMRNGHKIGGKFLDRIEDPKGTSGPPLDWIL